MDSKAYMVAADGSLFDCGYHPSTSRLTALIAALRCTPVRFTVMGWPDGTADHPATGIPGFGGTWGGTHVTDHTRTISFF